MLLHLYNYRIFWMNNLDSNGSYPWPDMLDLSADNRVHGVLVPIPVLTAPIDHSTVGTFDYIPEHTADTLTL